MGALHGFYLWVEKIIADFRHDKVKSLAVTPAGEAGVLGPVPEILKKKNVSNFMLALFTFFLINVTWVFFRSPDFTSAWHLLTSMFSHVPKGAVLLTTLSIIKISVIIFFVVIFHWLMRNTRVLIVAEKLPWWLLGIIWSVLLLLLIWSQESSSSFIYFQF